MEGIEEGFPEKGLLGINEEVLLDERVPGLLEEIPVEILGEIPTWMPNGTFLGILLPEKILEESQKEVWEEYVNELLKES